MRKSLRNLVAIAGFGLSNFVYPTSEAQERATWKESFEGKINREYIAMPSENWVTTSDNLEARDFEEKSGYLRFLFTDRNYSNMENLCISVDFRRSNWIQGDRISLIFGDIGEAYFEFGVNGYSETNQQYWLNRQSSRDSFTYANDLTNNIILNGINTLGICYDNQGWHFSINERELDSEKTRLLNIYLPSVIEGRIGLGVYDSTIENFSSITYFNNFLVSYDRAGECENFIRGDSNSDEKINISDVSFTLNWLFLGGPRPMCIEAADANIDERIDLSDPIYTLNSLFLGKK